VQVLHYYISVVANFAATEVQFGVSLTVRKSLAVSNIQVFGISEELE
jgi:hypothetical protein